MILISNKGAAFGITVARDVTDLYQTLTPENKLAFLKKLTRNLNLVTRRYQKL